MNDITDLRPTIIPKSDQLNADQLIGGPITVTVSKVVRVESKEQPITLHYAGDNGRPYKPCLTMRKVLIAAWGQDGSEWVGRSMTLYHDFRVLWAGVEVGGIRISHLSHISGNLKVSLAASKSKKSMHTIEPLVMQTVDHGAAINTATTLDALKLAFGVAYKSTKDDAERGAFKAAYDARLIALQNSSAT